MTIVTLGELAKSLEATYMQEFTIEKIYRWMEEGLLSPALLFNAVDDTKDWECLYCDGVNPSDTYACLGCASRRRM